MEYSMRAVSTFGIASVWHVEIEFGGAGVT